MNKEIMIVSGEASGDLHGAKVVEAMQQQQQHHFCGIGGHYMQQAGVEILFDAEKLAVVGLVEVISHIPALLAARSILVKRMKLRKPKLLILIDYPDFNLLLASKAKKMGIRVYYYISPQIWAWRKGRIKLLKKYIDRIGVILPFEKAFYESHGVEVDFVGNPLLDIVKPELSREQFTKKFMISSNKIIIGILPGSRKEEIATLLPIFLEAAKLITSSSTHDKQQFVFLIPRVAMISEALLAEHGLNDYQQELDIRVIDTERYDLMRACAGVMAASGTVTLELAILGIPMVVAYRLSWLSYEIAKRLVNLKYFSLVNLVAEREVVAELLQDKVTAPLITIKMLALLDNENYRIEMLKNLAMVKDRLGTKGGAERAAQSIYKLLIE